MEVASPVRISESFGGRTLDHWYQSSSTSDKRTYRTVTSTASVSPSSSTPSPSPPRDAVTKVSAKLPSLSLGVIALSIARTAGAGASSREFGAAALAPTGFTVNLVRASGVRALLIFSLKFVSLVERRCLCCEGYCGALELREVVSGGERASGRRNCPGREDILGVGWKGFNRFFVVGELEEAMVVAMRYGRGPGVCQVE